MIWFDVTKTAAQKHRSGLMRVSERLQHGFAARLGAGYATAAPSWVSSGARSATWRACLSSSSTPASPAPETA